VSIRLLAALATVVATVGATTAFAKDGNNTTVLQSALFGSQPTGPTLLGAKPGGAPWDISRGDVTVRRDGRLSLRIEGLVIPTAPQNGTNPLNFLTATVYCNGAPVVTSDPVAFSMAGDARVDTTLPRALPRQCLVPAVLINPAPGRVVNGGVYIAATGA
jgi:hypothetical protein